MKQFLWKIVKLEGNIIWMLIYAYEFHLHIKCPCKNIDIEITKNSAFFSISSSTICFIIHNFSIFIHIDYTISTEYTTMR